MPRTITLAALRTRVRELVDKPGTGYITDAMLNRFISSAYTELYDMLVRANPEYYYREQTLTGDGSASTFAVSSDYYGSVGVDYKVAPGLYTPLQRIIGADRNRYDFSSAGVARGWRMQYNATTPTTSLVQLLPTPSTGSIYRHTYVVAPADLSADANTIDGVSGWEQYVVVKAGIQIRIREEGNPQDLERELSRITKRIQEMVDNRMIESPATVGSSASFDAAWAELRGLRGR